MSEDIYHVLSLTAYDADLYPSDLKTALDTLDAQMDAGVFTDEEQGWAELLRLYLVTPIDQRKELPRTPEGLSSSALL